MNNKRKIVLSVICVVISLTLLGICGILAEETVIHPAVATTFITISLILVFVTILFAAKVDYETGVYKCRKCGHIFKPTFSAYLCGVHSLATRYLKCPECGAKSWCRRKHDD